MATSVWLLQKSKYVSPLGQNFEMIAVAQKHVNEVRSKSSSSIAWASIEGGQGLYNYDQIFTHEGSQVTLSFLNDNEVTVQENTLLRLQKTENGTQLNLDRGFIVANLSQGKGSDKMLFSVNGQIFEVSTAKSANVQIVREGETASLQVLNGEASLKHKGGESFRLEQNSQAIIDGDRPTLELLPLSNTRPDSGQIFYTNSSALVETRYTGETKGKAWTHLARDPFFKQIVQRSIRDKVEQDFRLEPGRYFWRLENKAKQALSLSTYFDVVLEKPPRWLLPRRKRLFFNLEVASKPSIDVDLKWQHENASGYLLSLEKDSKVWKTWSLKDPHYKVSLDETGRYEARVKVTGAGREEAIWSTSIELNLTQQAPSRPKLILPEDKSQVFLFQQETEIKLSWDRGLYAKKFEVHVWGENGSKVYKTQDSWLFLKLDSSGLYEWEVVAFSDLKKSESSQRFSFELNKKILSASSPADGAVIELNKPHQEVDFEWKKIEKAKSYSFELSRDPSFQNLTSSQKITSTQVKISIPETGIYYWRAKAINSNGKEVYSKPYKVLLTPTPPPPKPKLDQAPKVEYLESSLNFGPSSLWQAMIDLLISPAYAQEKKVKLSWPSAPFDVKAYKIRLIDNDGEVVFEEQVDLPEYVWQKPSVGNFTWEMAYVDYWDRVGPYSDPQEIEIEQLMVGVNSLDVEIGVVLSAPKIKQQPRDEKEINLLQPRHGKVLERPQTLRFKWALENVGTDIEKLYFELCNNLAFKELLIRREIEPDTSQIPLGVNYGVFPSDKAQVKYWRVYAELKDGSILISKRRRLEFRPIFQEKVIAKKKTSPDSYFEIHYLASQVNFNQTLTSSQEVKVSGSSIVGGAVSYTGSGWLTSFSLQSGQVFEEKDFRSTTLETLYRFDLPFFKLLDWRLGAVASHQSSFEVSSQVVQETGVFNFSGIAQTSYQSPQKTWSFKVDLLAGQLLGLRSSLKFSFWNNYFVLMNLHTLNFSDERSQSLIGVGLGKRLSWE